MEKQNCKNIMFIRSDFCERDIDGLDVKDYDILNDLTASKLYCMVVDYFNPGLPSMVWTGSVGDTPVMYCAFKSDDEEYSCKITLCEGWKEKILESGSVYFSCK